MKKKAILFLLIIGVVVLGLAAYLRKEEHVSAEEKEKACYMVQSSSGSSILDAKHKFQYYDENGNFLFERQLSSGGDLAYEMVDVKNQKIYNYGPGGCVVTDIQTCDSTLIAETFPYSLSVDENGDLYFYQWSNPDERLIMHYDGNNLIQVMDTNDNVIRLLVSNKKIYTLCHETTSNQYMIKIYDENKQLDRTIDSETIKHPIGLFKINGQVYTYAKEKETFVCISSDQLDERIVLSTPLTNNDEAFFDVCDDGTVMVHDDHTIYQVTNNGEVQIIYNDANNWLVPSLNHQEWIYWNRSGNSDEIELKIVIDKNNVSYQTLSLNLDEDQRIFHVYKIK